MDVTQAVRRREEQRPGEVWRRVEPILVCPQRDVGWLPDLAELGLCPSLKASRFSRTPDAIVRRAVFWREATSGARSRGGGRAPPNGRLAREGGTPVGESTDPNGG